MTHDSHGQSPWQPDRDGDQARGDGRFRAQRPERRSPGLALYAFVRSTLLTVAAVIGLVSAVVFVGALLLDVRPLIVASGSMEPALPVGSIVFARSVPASVPQAGDIVTVQRPRNLGLVTHRLVSSARVDDGAYEYVLRGDANAVDDPEPYLVETAGQYKFHVVGLGYLAHYLQIGIGKLIGLAIALLLVAVFILDPARFERSRAPAAEVSRPPDMQAPDGASRSARRERG